MEEGGVSVPWSVWKQRSAERREPSADWRQEDPWQQSWQVSGNGGGESNENLPNGRRAEGLNVFINRQGSFSAEKFCKCATRACFVFQRQKPVRSCCAPSKKRWVSTAGAAGPGGKFTLRSRLKAILTDSLLFQSPK